MSQNDHAFLQDVLLRVQQDTSQKCVVCTPTTRNRHCKTHTLASYDCQWVQVHIVCVADIRTW